MTKLIFQSLVQYQIDTDTGAISVLKKFTVPIKGAKSYNAKPKQVKQHNLSGEDLETEFL